METVLVLLALLTLLAVPIAVLVVPPLVMGLLNRWPLPSIGLWLAALLLLVAWVGTGVADMDRADATGGPGSWLAGIEWLLAAAVAAAAAVVVVRGRRHLGRAAG